MIRFFEVLMSCRTNLRSLNLSRGGIIDLTRPTLCQYLAFSDMYRNHHNWLTMHAPFNTFAERTTNRVLRNLGDAVNLTLVNGTEERRVRGQVELEQALNDGYYYRPGKPHKMENPCGEIILPFQAINNLMPESRIHIGGSPYTKHLIHGQLRLVMRHIYRFVFPGFRYAPIVEGLPYVELNKKGLAKLIGIGAPVFVRELIYAFYNQTRMPHWWNELYQLYHHWSSLESAEVFAQFVAKCLFDALDKGEAFKREWKTSTVMHLINVIHKDENFSIMPILADALQDAGCDNVDLLSHLRDTNAEFTLGSWVFRACGRLK